MKQAINFIRRTASYPLKKSYPLFEQMGPELQSLYKHIRLCFELPPSNSNMARKRTFKRFVDKVISWNLTSVLSSYGKKNSSFAEWNECSDASEAKDCSDSEKYSSEVSQSTVDIFSQNTRKGDWGEPLTSRAIKLRNHQGTRFQ